MSFSVRVGGMKGWSLMDPCKFYPSTTSWPVRSGLPILFSTTERSLWLTTWPRQTNFYVWSTTAHSSTQWGETVSDICCLFFQHISMLTFAIPNSRHCLLSCSIRANFCADPFSSLLTVKLSVITEAHIDKYMWTFRHLITMRKCLKREKHNTLVLRSFPLELRPYVHSVSTFKIV